MVPAVGRVEEGGHHAGGLQRRVGAGLRAGRGVWAAPGAGGQREQGEPQDDSRSQRRGPPTSV